MEEEDKGEGWKKGKEQGKREKEEGRRRVIGERNGNYSPLIQITTKTVGSLA